MKQIFFAFVLLIISICFLQLILPLSLNEGISINTKDFENVGILNNMEVSEAGTDKSKNMNYELKKFYDGEDVGQISEKNYETLKETVANYIQRYISLFLITSNLINYQIKNSDEKIMIDLEIVITGQDLAYLQNYSKNFKDLNYQKTLSKLDAIFSKIARLKERSYAERGMRFSVSLITNFIFSLLNHPSFYRFFSFGSILIAIWTTRYYLFNKSFYIFLVVFINSTIIWEGLNMYSKKIKESDLEIYVQAMQFKGIPEECDPNKGRWYHSIVNFFNRNKCLQYYKTLNKNAVDEVSLFKCVIDMYAFYFLRTPVRIYGMTIRDLAEELSASCPWPLSYFINIPLVPLFAVFGGVFILILFGKRFKLSFWGTSVEIGDVKTVPENKMIDNSNNEKPKQIRVRRMIKPWTKSRFPKRLEGDLGRRRKLFLKSSKSTIELPELCQT